MTATRLCGVCEGVVLMPAQTRRELSQHILLEPIGTSKYSPDVQEAYRGAVSRAETDRSDFVSWRQPTWYEKRPIVQ